MRDRVSGPPSVVPTIGFYRCDAVHHDVAMSQPGSSPGTTLAPPPGPASYCKLTFLFACRVGRPKYIVGECTLSTIARNTAVSHCPLLHSHSALPSSAQWRLRMNCTLLAQ
ncbi:hypothetical protein DL89DRAFT_270154, partial [Linderina pennispora]